MAPVLPEGHLHLSSLVKRYPDFTLGPIDSALPRGVTGLLGENGAGKTTLLRLIVGTSAPTSGHISLPVDGQGTRVGFLPQDFAAPTRVSAQDYLAYIAWCRSTRRDKITHAHIADALAAVALSSVARSRIGTLSGGMLRRLGLAQALLGGANILILDEPTVGLDPVQRQEIRALLRDLGERAVVLMSTHLAEDIVSIAGRVMVLSNGALLYDGSVGELCGGRKVSSEALEAGFLRVVGHGGAHAA